MKIFIFLLFSLSCIGQDLKTELPYYEEKFIVISGYDTTVIYGGKTKCLHDFLSEKQGNRTPASTICLVFHDQSGCPDNWSKVKKICRKCLRHIQINENRYILQSKDEYSVLLEKLNELKKQKP